MCKYQSSMTAALRTRFYWMWALSQILQRFGLTGLQVKIQAVTPPVITAEITLATPAIKAIIPVAIVQEMVLEIQEIKLGI